MKNILILVLMLVSVACGQLVDDMNENPNSPTSASYGFVMTGAEVGTLLFHEGETARKANIFSGHLSGIDRQHKGFNDYTVSTGDFDAQWDDAYVHAIRNALEAEVIAREDGVEGITAGICKTLQALSFGTMTALYGDIPFDEAGFITFENPAFEQQVDVYDKLQQLLDDAISAFAVGGGRPVAGADIYFDGDVNAWTEVAYSLKARYYLHTKNYPKAYEAALNGISSHAHSMMAPHVQAQTGSNLYHQFFWVSRPNDMKVSEFFGDMLDPAGATYRGNSKTDEAARFAHYFTTNSNGLTVNNEGYMALAAAFPLVTFAENLLILAEAGLRNEGFATGLSHLNNFRSYMQSGGYMDGVEAATPGLQYDAYDANDFSSGGIENPDNIASDQALLREILQERYVTLFAQIEAFNDVRRTQDESVRVPVQPNTGHELPQRFLYPQSEIDRNPNTPDPLPGFFDRTTVNQ